MSAEIQPFVDLQATLFSMIGMFNPNASGDALDKVGVWVGANRDVQEPISGVYFAWGYAGSSVGMKARGSRRGTR